jgi:urease accessory protein
MISLQQSPLTPMISPASQPLLKLLQLASPALPVGAFSYSEGLETLVHHHLLTQAEALNHWLVQELDHGAITLEASVLGRAWKASQEQDCSALHDWNQWISALRETEEMRNQSWQMGRSLQRLLSDLDPTLQPLLDACGEPCNFATAFAIAASHWDIDCKTAILGYLHSWASNQINAGVKLIPLGQTAGQQLLLNLLPTIEDAADHALNRLEDEMVCCGWGVAIASMNHETLYSRLFRS